MYRQIDLPIVVYTCQQGLQPALGAFNVCIQERQYLAFGHRCASQAGSYQAASLPHALYVDGYGELADVFFQLLTQKLCGWMKQ